jgi:hypothetical protein
VSRGSLAGGLGRTSPLALLIGSALAVGACCAQARAASAELTLCNAAGERLADLSLTQGTQVVAAATALAAGDCVQWGKIEPGVYWLHYMLGESSRALLCALPIELASPRRLAIGPDTQANCIK